MDPMSIQTRNKIRHVNAAAYLDRSSFFEQFENKIADFTNKIHEKLNPFPIMDLTIAVEISKLANISEYLAEEIIQEPNNVQFLFRDIILLTLRKLLKRDIEEHQVNIIVRTNDSLVIPKYNSINLRNIKHSGALVTFDGVLMKRTPVQKYIHTAVWSCPQAICNGKLTATRSILPFELPKCSNCFSPLVEQMKYSKVTDRVQGIMINKNSFQNSSCRISRGILITFEGDLTNDLEPGVQYTVTGVLNSQYTAVNGLLSPTFFAWNCKRSLLINPCVELEPTGFIQLMHQAYSDSPYKFVHALALQIGATQKMLPANTYKHLKMGLLLSLASLEPSDLCSPIPVLAVGADTLVASQLQSLAAHISPRHIKPAPGALLGGSMKSGEWYEAGALIQARNGVCNLGDWSKYAKGKDNIILKSVLESGVITMDMQENVINPTTIDLNCAIWTHWNYRNKVKDLMHLKTLVEIFGIPFLADPNEDEHESETNHILHCAMGLPTETNGVVTNEELKNYITMVVHRKVTVLPNAEKLMTDYFVATRKTRSGCLSTMALKRLVSISEAHARLALRDEVKLEDAIAAISLCEAAMQAVFGSGMVEPSPYPYAHKNINEHMRQFECWLTEFLTPH